MPPGLIRIKDSLLSKSKNKTETLLTIAFHADGKTAGGLGAFVRHLAHSFQERGHKVIIFVNQPGPFSEEMSNRYDVFSFGLPPISSPGIHIGSIRVPNPLIAAKNLLSLSRNKKQVLRILRQANPDVILGNGIASAAILGSSCSRLGIRLVCCIHGIGKRGNDLFSMRARIAARFLNQADAVVGVSNTCLERFLPFLSVPNETIYNCCPPIKTENLKPDFLRRQGLPADTTLIGSFGRIMHAKGYHVLIKAYSQLEPVKQQAAAIVIGGKPLNRDEDQYLLYLKKLATDLGLESRCFFIGETTPQRFFSILDIFCHTYLGEEAFGFTILEAMLAGCPTIAVDLGGPKEIIDDAWSGQLVPPNDPLLLAMAIEKYLVDPQYALNSSRNALKQVNEKFDFHDWPTNWLSLFYKVLNTSD